MKLVIDKIDAHPPHAFSSGEFRAFMRLVPVELWRDVALVRLSSAAVPRVTPAVASFSRLERRLVIASRNVSRDVVMLEVLRCLIANNLSRPASYGRGPVKLPRARVDRMAKDLLAQIAPQMPAPAHWSRLHLKYLTLKMQAGDIPPPPTEGSRGGESAVGVA